MTNYKKYNAAEVLEQVELHIENINRQPRRRYSISKVYEPLSIFDWWPEYLSEAKFKDMRKFLKAAIKHGYTGYVCFKVGASGCANGMWAHKNETTNGYSPDGECLYKSFTPDYNYWQVKDADGNWLPETKEVEIKRGDMTYLSHEGYDSCKTLKQLDALIESM